MLGRSAILPHLNTMYSESGSWTLEKFAVQTIFNLKTVFSHFDAYQKCSVFTFTQYIYLVFYMCKGGNPKTLNSKF